MRAPLRGLTQSCQSSFYFLLIKMSGKGWKYGGKGRIRYRSGMVIGHKGVRARLLAVAKDLGIRGATLLTNAQLRQKITVRLSVYRM